MNFLTYGEACATVIERCPINTVTELAREALAVQNEDDKIRGQHAVKLLHLLISWRNEHAGPVRRTLTVTAQAGGYCTYPACSCNVITPLVRCKRFLEITP
jgi:hypothetical protein